MALWNKVLSGFDAEDETVNFGARTVAESYDSVYEITTLATIQTQDKVVKNPQVVTSIEDCMLCISIDKSITIFEDLSCRDIRLCIGFDSLITSHYISTNLSFLFVTLNNGSLYCLNLEAGGRLVFIRNVIRSQADSGEIIVKTFLEVDQLDSSNLLLVTSKGHIHRLSGFDAQIMVAVFEVEDTSKLKELTKNIECHSVFRQRSIQEVHNAVTGLLNQQQSIVMVGEDIYVWPSQCFSSFNALPYKYIKIRYLRNQRSLLCVRCDGALNIVCPYTLLGRKVWDGPVSDIMVIDNEPDTPTQILILLKPQTGSSTTFLQLVSFPDFQVKFNLQVSSTTSLVDFSSGSTNEIIFLEGTSNTMSAIDTIRIKAVEETLPECQLQRLLRRSKYEEAESFAKRFNLDTDTIYTTKAVALTKQCSTLASENVSTSTLKELIDTLNKVKNIELVIACCHNIVTTDFKQNRELFSYARERLMESAEKRSDDLVTAHLLELNNTILRTQTYEMIHKTKENTVMCDNEGSYSWVEFSKSNLLKECKKYLALGEIKIAALIWVRHSSSLLNHLTTTMVREMLEKIPDRTPQQDLWPWLFHFVPSLLSVFPDGLSEIVTWGYRRAKSLEKFDHNNWPGSGLEFCEGLLNLFNFGESQSFFHLQQQYNTKHSPLQHLNAVIQALTDLQNLQKNYRLVVKIDEYMGEPMEVAHILLHKVHQHEVCHFIPNFLHGYMLNHSLSNDHVLALYIQQTLKRSEGWWFWEEAPWEKKIVDIISCIHNIEIRLQQTLLTLKKASVPWSPTILALVETSICNKHPLVSEIIAERKSVASKLILKKYGYQHIGINDSLIKYIIKQNRDGMLTDIYELTKSNHLLKIRALSQSVNYFVDNGDLEKVTTLINCMTDEDAMYCCKQIVNYISVCVQFKETNNTPDYYAELLDIMQVKLKGVTDRETPVKDDTLITASELKSLCQLRKEFGFNLTLTDYQTRQEIILQNHLEHLCDDLRHMRLSAFATCKKATRVASLLGLPQILAICSLLEITQNKEILKYYIETKGSSCFTVEECPYVERLCKICILDMKIGELDTLDNVKNMSASALDSCSIGQLSQILSTTSWINLSCKIYGNQVVSPAAMKNVSGDKTPWRLYRIYTDTAICTSHMNLRFLQRSFECHSFCTDNKKMRGNSTLFQQNDSSPLSDLITEIKSIPKENYDFSFLQILNSLISFCCSTVSVEEHIFLLIQSVRDTCLNMVLQKIISARTFDLQSGLSCLYMFSEPDAFKWLTSASKMYQSDYSRHCAISDLGYEYCHLSKNDTHLSYFTYYRICHSWAKRLYNYGIQPKEILTSHTEGKQKILERLMRSVKSGCIELLKEFCTDFDFDLDECYILYLDILLKQWNPTIKIVSLQNEKELRIEEDEVATLHKTCKDVAALIEHKSSLQNHLATLWLTVNFYHYEVFLLIMEMLEDRNEQRLNHFCFLQNYVRIGKPTQLEYEEWSHICPEDSSLPEISQWRLPYLPKIDLWKLITPELNLSTYKKWIDIASVLKLQVHIICTIAIKGSITQIWGAGSESKKGTSEWQIHSKNPALLEDITACIKHMPDQDAPYYGTAVLYYVVNHCQPGADQTAAAKECYAYAQKWAQASHSDKVMIEKIKFKYVNLSAKHVLYTHGLGKNHYLQLINSPEQLIRELYLDKSIVLRGRGATEHRPDINLVANEVGKIFSLNVLKLRLELLEEWLQSNESSTKLDDSMTYNIITQSSEDNTIDDDNLLRACYILEWGDKVMSANYLINTGFGNESEHSFRPGVQFRALYVLLAITDWRTVQDLTKRDLQSIKQYMKSLQYLNKLERLGFIFSVQRFEDTPKLELAQALFRSHMHLPEALVLILQICIDFELRNYVLWDETLCAMVKLSMVTELRKFLPKVSTVSHVVGCNGYVKGWELLIWDPFRKTNALFSQKQFDECIAAICLIPSCPVAHELNLKPVVKICFQSHHPELAAALIPFLTESDVNYVVKEINSLNKAAKVLKDLCALSTQGILTISYSVQILEQMLPANLMEN